MCGRPCLLPKNGLGSAVSFLVGSAAYPPANCSYGAENLSYNFYILVEFLLESKPVIKTLRIGVEQATKMTVAARSCMSMHWTWIQNSDLSVNNFSERSKLVQTFLDSTSCVQHTLSLLTTSVVAIGPKSDNISDKSLATAVNSWQWLSNMHWDYCFQ